ncbi:MAG: hypothetical protein LBR57_00675 [Alistipes sp.]|jgi:hypothetical protein|nr:hypothetical protein [Alistipes sp.]
MRPTKIVAALSLAATLATASCVRETLLGGKADDEPVEVNFTVTIPDTQPTPASTRSTLHTDTQIQNVELFVFDGGAGGLFVEQAMATNIVVTRDPSNNGAAVCTFSARLLTSSTPRLIFFVANSRNADNTNRLYRASAQEFAGKTYTQVMNSLRTTSMTTPVTEEQLSPLIMWGKLGLTQIVSEQSPAERVKLMRVVAAVTVSTAAATSDNGLENFTVNAVSAGGVTLTGRVAPPDIWNDWNNSDPATQIPGNSFPETLIDNHFGTTSGSGYWSLPSDPHYIHESRGNNAYILLDATWNGTRYYYKLQLKNAISGQNIDYIRNHKYNITIIKVNGPGHTSITAAINGNVSNDAIETHVDEFNQLVSFHSNGQDYLGLSCNEIFIINEGGSGLLDLAVAFTTRHTLTIEPYSGPAVSNPSAVYDAGTGLWTIRGYANGAGNGTLTVTDGMFTEYITVGAKAPSTGGTSGGGNYGADDLISSAGLLGLSTKAPWYLEILPGSRNVFLNTSTSESGAPLLNAGDSGSNWGTWGLTSVSSATLTGNSLYLFMSKKGAPARGIIRGMYTSGGNIVNVYWVINGNII